MFKKDWLKVLKKRSSSKGSDPMKMEITPFRDWRIVAGTFFVGIATSVGLNIYMSIQINSDTFFTATPTTSAGVVFNKDGLTKILTSFAEKEILFEKTKKEGVPVVDPSL